MEDKNLSLSKAEGRFICCLSRAMIGQVWFANSPLMKLKFPKLRVPQGTKLPVTLAVHELLQPGGGTAKESPDS